MTQLSWQPTKQQLEDAALAGGIKGQIEESDYDFWFTTDNDWTWQPYLPSDQGKADLLDLMLALPMDVDWDEVTKIVTAGFFERDEYGYLVKEFFKQIKITNNDKHEALARAVIEVAAQVGGVMRNNTMRGEV